MRCCNFQNEALAQPQQLHLIHLRIQHAVRLQVDGICALAQVAFAVVGRLRGKQGLAVLPAGMRRLTGTTAPSGRVLGK